MRVSTADKKVNTGIDSTRSARRIYLSKAGFRRTLDSCRVSDSGDSSSVVKIQFSLLKQLSRFNIGEFVLVTTFKNQKYTRVEGRIVGYTKPPDLVMGIQETGKKKITNIDINPCNYGDFDELEVKRSNSRHWVELLNIQTGEVPLHILKCWGP